MKTKYYLFILIALCLFSCGGKNHQSNKLETISINGNIRQALNLSSFVDTIEFIPLETNEENLIGIINRIVYKDGKYYIRSTQSMLHGKLSVFDDAGKYLWGLNKIGNGPGEYPELKDFAIVENGNIIVLSYRKIIKYDSSGVFLSENKMDFLGFEFVYMKDNNFTILNYEANLNNNRQLSVIDEKGNIKRQFFKESNLESKKSRFMVEWRSLFPFKSNIYFMYPYCDTLYVIEKNKYIKRLYYVNYGNNKIPANLLKANDDLYSWDKKLLNLGDYMHTTAIGYTDNYIYISSVNKAYQGFFTLYSKKK